MDKFLDRQKLSKLTEDRVNFNTSMSMKEIEVVIIPLPQRKLHL